MRFLLPALIAAPIALGAVAAQADAPPVLDVASTCRSSGSANPDENRGANGCLRSEREAQDTLKQRWSQFGPDSKRQCSQQSRAGGFPSYVELLTCLELATGNVQVQSGRDPGATGSVGGKPADMPSTDADADTRIDPKAVLGKPTGG
jgi:hypothetical protein